MTRKELAAAWREYGAVMRQNRTLLGISLREAATRAGISRNTVARLESGLPVQRTSVERLCRVYGCVPTDPTTRRPPVREGRYYRLHSNADAVWYTVRVNGEGLAEGVESERAADPRERRRLGSYGLADFFVRPLRCRREGSRLIPFVLELYKATDANADPVGERFVLGLKGRVRVHLGDDSFEVGEGEAAVYDCTVKNWLEPAEPVPPGGEAPLALQIYLP